MKSIMRALDRFCARHPRWGIPNLMPIIVIVSVAVYFISMMDMTGTFLGLLLLDMSRVLRGEIWRLVTFIFVPDTSSMLSLALTLYFSYFIGNALEGTWGTAKFTLYYLLGVLFQIIASLALYFFTGYSFFAGAHYLNLALLFAFATFYPDMQILLFFIIPIKIKWIALLDAAYFLLAVVLMPFPFNMLPVVAILNYLLFCGSFLVGYIQSFVRRRGRRAKIYDFKNESARMRRSKTEEQYTRRCAVCGRTDVSNPELQFRYCSGCVGDHCYCQDHIGNHVHFQS